MFIDDSKKVKLIEYTNKYWAENPGLAVFKAIPVLPDNEELLEMLDIDIRDWTSDDDWKLSKIREEAKEFLTTEINKIRSKQ